MDACETDSDDSAVAFAVVDFAGVDFDASVAAAAVEQALLDWELCLAWQDTRSSGNIENTTLRELGELLAKGRYAEILASPTATALLDGLALGDNDRMAEAIRRQVHQTCRSLSDALAWELVGVAALNLFLQANYTGPILDEASAEIQAIHPHACFRSLLIETDSSSESKHEEEKRLTASKSDNVLQNKVLAELAVEGEWPCQVSTTPYFLLLARSILLVLAHPTRPDWTHSFGAEESTTVEAQLALVDWSQQLQGVRLWSARATVAHERLLQSREPSATLWQEAKDTFAMLMDALCSNTDPTIPDRRAATVWLEYGLAEHHFDRPGRGKQSFQRAQAYSGLSVEVTGAMGKRTKFQQDAKAQILVKATSASGSGGVLVKETQSKEPLQKQMVEHTEDGILLERIKFEDDKENEITELDILDQAIVLSLCLDVKNNNPNDGLTAEEMGAFLARVLDHHDDWMIYSTALLERAWLEFERSHARERAILQMQALADQHTERLTLTQSTRQSIDDSAPVQDRLQMLHCIVYPPRWSMIQDLADRYEALGVVTSAAELYTQVELWDDVVDCYRRAGRTNMAEKIVRERLTVQETPRMWTALGDLTGDSQFYHKAIDVSNGRYSAAFVSLGGYYFEKGDLSAAADQYEKAVRIKPLSPFVWFRLGTISMQLEQWDTALKAFSEVVQQEPEEAEAWANVAAIHMHNKKPAEAYPALNEALKFNRNNWRIWVSKLYTCLDLHKYDEAIQCCNSYLDLKARKQAAENIPPLEEKCIKAVVGGALDGFRSGANAGEKESARRTLSRVYHLLNRLSSSSDADAWIHSTMAFFHEQVGQDDRVLDDLMKEYRGLQTMPGWERDNFQLRKVVGVVSHIVDLHMSEGSKASLTKSRLMARNVVSKIDAGRPDDPTLPEEVNQLRVKLTEVGEKIKSLS